MWMRSLQVHAASPMRHLRRQVPVLNKLLKLDLSPQESEAVQEACARSGVRFGAYYHWYLQKMIVANHVRHLDRDSMLEMVAQMDHTDYGALDARGDDPGGLVVAIPHHGHYILSIVGLLERLRGQREVFVFYGAPETHAGNEIFDRLHDCLYSDARSGVRVIHDTRSGIASALRGLHNGAVVIIMPDVYKHEKDTFLVPFCGRSLDVMLGTAVLARKTGSSILPVVSETPNRGLGFKSTFAGVFAPLDQRGSMTSSGHAGEDTLHLDYRTTVKMFHQFERMMSHDIIRWQYARTHYTKRTSPPDLDPETLQTVADLFFCDPRVNIDLSHPVRLD